MIIDYNGLKTMALLVGVAAMAMDNVEDIEAYDITAWVSRET